MRASTQYDTGRRVVDRVAACSLLLVLLLLPACGRSGGAARDGSAARPPARAVESTPLGGDGLPVGWIDAPYATRELYFEAAAPGPCPPCPEGAQCSPCPPPFARFSTRPAGDAGGVMVFVAFRRLPTGLKEGGFYRLSGRTVTWRPHGEVFVSMDDRLREWLPPERCAKLAAEYVAGRGASGGACTKDGDCTILPGGVDDCGRAMDRISAARLEPTYRMFRERCGLKLHCGPRVAFPACAAGRCVERSGRPGTQGHPGTLSP